MSFEQMPQGLDLPQSGLRDNFQRGSVGEFLREKIQPGSTLSLVSAYFTIYAYAALQDRLDTVEHVRFLFGEPRFVRTLDPARTDRKAYRIEDSGLKLSNRLQQGSAARACAACSLSGCVVLRCFRLCLRGLTFPIRLPRSSVRWWRSERFQCSAIRVFAFWVPALSLATAIRL